MKIDEMMAKFEKLEACILTAMQEDKQREIRKEHETLEMVRSLPTETLEVEAVLLKVKYKYQKAVGILEMFMAFVGVCIVCGFLNHLEPVVEVTADALYVSWTVILTLLVFLFVLMFVFLRNNVGHQSRIYHQLLLVEMVRKEKGMRSDDFRG